MSISRTVITAALVLASGVAIAGMVTYTRRVETAMKTATVDGGTITLLKERKAVEPFTVKALDGSDVSPASLRGKVVIVNFWATWCPPCREEIPDLIALQAKYKDQLQIIGVSMDDDAAAAKEVAGRFAFNYPLLMGDAKFGHRYGGILGLPSAFLIGRDGKIVKILRGELKPGELDRAIQSALGS